MNFGIKPPYPTRSNKTVHQKQTVSSAKPRFTNNNKQAQTVNKPLLKKTAGKNQQWKPKVSTAKPTVPTIRPKVETVKHKQVVNGKLGNAVKATTQ